MGNSEAFLLNYLNQRVCVRQELDNTSNGDYYMGDVTDVHIRTEDDSDTVSYLILNGTQIIYFDHDHTVIEFLKK